jgi:uncharacterized protein YbjT (DUF2867 family)
MNVFMTGATGYIGRHLIPELLRRGHVVRALVRDGSEKKLARGAIAVRGNALDRATFAGQIAPSDTFVQLVGVAHPSPAKAAEFRAVDLVSVTESVEAACRSTIHHFVYLSVAQPAPIMREYVEFIPSVARDQWSRFDDCAICAVPPLIPRCARDKTVRPEIAKAAAIA